MGRGKTGERTEERLKEQNSRKRNSATEHKDSKINRKQERLISGPKKQKSKFPVCVYVCVRTCECVFS